MSAPPTAPPVPAPVDLITALQEQLARLNAMLFNYIGALQRDAPPQSLKGEALVAPPKSYDVQARRGLTQALCQPCRACLSPPTHHLGCLPGRRRKRS